MYNKLDVWDHFPLLCILVKLIITRKLSCTLFFFEKVVKWCNKLLNDNIKYLGVGGHLFAIAAKKSVDNGFDGYLYGFAANQELLKHYVTVFNAEAIGILHPYQFAIDETNALEIMEVYDYEWTDEKI